MTRVSIRELRNHGGEVADRVVKGETLIVTRDGHPVAELRPLGGPVLSATNLLQRWRKLPSMDPVKLLADIDDVLNPQL
jgi:prevent-host-death family protein